MLEVKSFLLQEEYNFCKPLLDNCKACHKRF